MERNTPVPEPMPFEKFDDIDFEEFEAKENMQEYSDTHSNSTSDNFNTGRRRTKAERMKNRGSVAQKHNPKPVESNKHYTKQSATKGSPTSISKQN